MRESQIEKERERERETKTLYADSNQVSESDEIKRREIPSSEQYCIYCILS